MCHIFADLIGCILLIVKWVSKCVFFLFLFSILESMMQCTHAFEFHKRKIRSLVYSCWNFVFFFKRLLSIHAMNLVKWLHGQNGKSIKMCSSTKQFQWMRKYPIDSNQLYALECELNVIQLMIQISSFSF